MEKLKQNPIVKKLGLNRILLACILVLMFAAARRAQCGWLYSEMVASGANPYAGQEQCRFY